MKVEINRITELVVSRIYSRNIKNSYQWRQPYMKVEINRITELVVSGKYSRNINIWSPAIGCSLSVAS